MLIEWHNKVREDIKSLEPWQNRVGGKLMLTFKGHVVRIDFEKEGRTTFLEAIYRPSKVTRSLVDYWLTYSVIQKGSMDLVTDSMALGLRMLEKHPEQILGLLEVKATLRNMKFWNHLAWRMLGCL